jgi:hypothetical protein
MGEESEAAAVAMPFSHKEVQRIRDFGESHLRGYSRTHPIAPRPAYVIFAAHRPVLDSSPLVIA